MVVDQLYKKNAMKKILNALLILLTSLQLQAQVWVQQPVVVPKNFLGCWFNVAHPDTGIITGYYSVSGDAYPFACKTTDGGLTMDYQSLYHGGNMLGAHAVYFTNENTGYIAGGGMAKTTDGGTTWTLLMGWSGPGGKLYDVLFDSQDTGYTVGEKWFGGSGGPEGIIGKTNNAGATWSFHTISIDAIGESANLRTIARPTPTAMYAGATSLFPGPGGYSTLFKSNDDGLTWTTLNFYDNVYSLFFISGDTGFAATDLGIMKTTDGAGTWNTVLNTTTDVKCIRIKNNFGIAVCANGSIYETTNSGDTWNAMVSPVQGTASLNNVFILSPQLAYAVGNSGVLLKYSTVTGVVDFQNSVDKFSLYPNPCSEKVQLNFNAEDNSKYSLTIYNLIGEEVSKDENVKSSQVISVEKLEVGTYIVRLSNSKNNLWEKMMVIK
jgi:photosystem II stability/assembly factor-like uncharacterized protein